uniref:NTPase KAP family P-loop domain-containing protein 1-like n=1 Tax=Myxine glutinosa TaxID=7769 RepID=UPI00358ED1B4
MASLSHYVSVDTCDGDDDSSDPRIFYDHYAECLAKALSFVKTPVTIGVYAPWGSGTNVILKKIEESLKTQEEITHQKEMDASQETPRTAKKLGFLHLLFRLLFFSPIITAKQLNRKRVRFIFVPYNAWEFAGSDRLWAGMVTTLCAHVRNSFRPLPTSIYRALGKSKVPVIEDSLYEWKPVKYLCVPAWIATIIIVVLAIILVIVIVVLGFPSNFGGDIVSTLEGIGASIVGLSTIVIMKNVGMVAYNFAMTQKSQVEKLMDNQDFSTQLGFMQMVKKEVQIITNFLRYMEVFERCKLRLVLKIQDLDRCPQEKITSVLEAMNILLSDNESRFISLLAVDPTVIIDSFEHASQKNGYEILNRTVDLPFSIPEMGDDVKLNFLKDLLRKTEREADGMDSQCKPTDTEKSAGYHKGGAGKLVQEAFRILKQSDTQMLCNIDQSYIKMRRIINSVPIIIRLLFAKYGHLPNPLTPERIVAWTVLSTQWPCRLSWVLQCEEDIKERRRNTNKESIEGNRYLWDIYTESMEELCVLMSGLDQLFVLDGDPEVFEKHLNQDYPFTTSDVEILHPVTVNLDRSIQRRMELLRGKYNIRNFQLQDSGKNALSPLQTLNVFSLTSEEICSELGKIFKDNKRLSVYKQCIMEEDITGKVLLHSSESEIQAVLNMRLADWVLFRAHFLLGPRHSDPMAYSSINQRSKVIGEKKHTEPPKESNIDTLVTSQKFKTISETTNV